MIFEYLIFLEDLASGKGCVKTVGRQRERLYWMLKEDVEAAQIWWRKSEATWRKARWRAVKPGGEKQPRNLHFAQPQSLWTLSQQKMWLEWREGVLYDLNRKFCYWSKVVMWLIWVGETRFYSSRLWYIMPVRYIKLGHQIPSWVTTKKWNLLLNPSQCQLDVSQTLVSRHPEKSPSDNTGKYYKTSLKGVWFFYKFFIFWSLFWPKIFFYMFLPERWHLGVSVDRKPRAPSL